MQLCAGTAVRIGARRGPLAGLMTTGATLADRYREFVPVDGVGAIAVIRLGRPVKKAFVGADRSDRPDSSGATRCPPVHRT
jgi:hypothetical protein